MNELHALRLPARLPVLHGHLESGLDRARTVARKERRGVTGQGAEPLGELVGDGIARAERGRVVEHGGLTRDRFDDARVAVAVNRRPHRRDRVEDRRAAGIDERRTPAAYERPRRARRNRSSA